MTIPRIIPFCIPGKHAIRPSHPWRTIQASKIDGKWVFDDKSQTRIVCCPEHDPTRK